MRASLRFCWAGAASGHATATATPATSEMNSRRFIANPTPRGRILAAQAGMLIGATTGLKRTTGGAGRAQSRMTQPLVVQRFDFPDGLRDRPLEVFLAAFLVAAAFLVRCPSAVFRPRFGAFFAGCVRLVAPFLIEAGTRFATAFFARLATDRTAVAARAPAATAAKSVI